MRNASVMLLCCLSPLSTAALAADPIAEAELSHGFKPEFVKEDGAGRYDLASFTFGVSTELLSASLTQAVIRAPHPTEHEHEVLMQDPTLGLSSRTKILPESLALGLSGGLSVTPGFYEESRSLGYMGSARANIGLSRAFGPVTFGLGSSFTHRVHKYTLDLDGRANPRDTVSASGSIRLALGEQVSLGVNLAYLKTSFYYGKETYRYSNAATVNVALTDHVSVFAGISTSDSQLSPAGDDNYAGSLYKRNQTEAQIGASFAL